MLASGLIIGSVLYLIGQNAAGALGLGLALALSSTALVLPMSGTKSPVGRAALAMLLFEDVAIVPIIFLLGAISPAITADGGWDDLGRTLLMGGAVIIGQPSGHHPGQPGDRRDRPVADRRGAARRPADRGN